MYDYDVAVVGAGAAGMLAAARAGERGLHVVLLEKNHKAGVKILMSGGTRCNLTQATDRRGIVEAFGPQGNFLHSALAALGPDELVALFKAEGVPTKVEPTGKVFPVSNRALDVRDALLRLVRRAGVELRLGDGVTQLATSETGFAIQTERRELSAEKVILTSGGQSYPGCGTTGDGYAWAKQLGHKIVPPRPSLVPLVSSVRWIRELRGVTIADVRVQIWEGESAKPVAERRGSFLFTHFGISGPVIMDVSRAVTARPDADDWRAVCDFLPGHSREQLLEVFAQGASSDGKRNVRAVIGQWLPQRLAETLTIEAGLQTDQRLAELSKASRRRLVDALKAHPIPIQGSLGFKKAEVTAGGIDLSEIDSRTMQSKLVPGLYVAGEILDLDGPIGGYNFQAAFSTGWLAGESV